LAVVSTSPWVSTALPILLEIHNLKKGVRKEGC
jgi:hypothetical protein